LIGDLDVLVQIDVGAHSVRRAVDGRWIRAREHLDLHGLVERAGRELDREHAVVRGDRAAIGADALAHRARRMATLAARDREKAEKEDTIAPTRTGRARALGTLTATH